MTASLADLREYSHAWQRIEHLAYHVYADTGESGPSPDARDWERAATRVLGWDAERWADADVEDIRELLRERGVEGV